MKKSFTLLLVSLVLGIPCFGSGYQVLLQGNRTTGMGNLGVAMYADASSLFFNPGAMGFMDHNSIMIGTNPIFASNTYWDSENPNSSYQISSNNPTGTPFHAYAVWGPSESRFKFGIGVVTPFGSGVNWGTSWSGRDLLNEIDLSAIQVQPTLAFKINEKLSIGGGLDITFGSVRLTRSIFLLGREGSTEQYFEGSTELDGNANTALGYNLGIFYKVSDFVDLGLSYRSEVTVKVEGGNTEFVVPQSISAGFPEGNTFSAELPLPSVIGLGATFHINERFDLGAQFDWVGWSAYKSLDIEFAQTTPLLQNTSSLRNYEDSWVLHLGGEYRFDSNVQVRAGFYYDTTPVQDGYMTAETPDNDRLGLTAGVGYDFGRLQLDLSFLYIHSAQREQTTEHAINAGTLDPVTGTRDVLPGTYKLNALIPGLSIAYKF